MPSPPSGSCAKAAAAYVAASPLSRAASLRWPRARRAISVELGAWSGRAGRARPDGAGGPPRRSSCTRGFYYPDVKRARARSPGSSRAGASSSFLRDFTANQYRYSLGLQFESGHWYAFPYPPAFYLLYLAAHCMGSRAARGRGLAAWRRWSNSLEALVVFAIARRLRLLGARWPWPPRRARRCCRSSSSASALAYFPALVGHALDALVLFVLLAAPARLRPPSCRSRASRALLALALLTYTQSLLNFAVLLPLFLARGDRARPFVEAHRSGWPARSVLGVVLSLAVFYGRYVPIFARHDARRADARGADPAREAGARAGQSRGDRRRPSVRPRIRTRAPASIRCAACARPAGGCGCSTARSPSRSSLGLVLLFRTLDGAARCASRSTWAATYLVLNLLSGGLPGPNLVRYNKDHEIVAPLFCVAIAVLGGWLWRRSRLLGDRVCAGLRRLRGGARLVRVDGPIRHGAMSATATPCGRRSG